MRFPCLFLFALLGLSLQAQVVNDSSKKENQHPLERHQKKDTTHVPVDRSVMEKDTGGAGERMEVRRSYVRRKGAGYRIQIFTGGNSRTDRIRANRMGGLCRSYFPELSVYTHFESPRWICRVGDFKTAEDARVYVRKMRNLKVFKELRIVRSVVWQYW